MKELRNIWGSNFYIGDRKRDRVKTGSCLFRKCLFNYFFCERHCFGC